METNKNNTIGYVRIMGFSDEANNSINRAIEISRESMCKKVNLTHLFLALLENESDTSNEIKKYMSKDIPQILKQYNNFMLSNGYDTTKEKFELSEDIGEIFSNDLMHLCAIISNYHYNTKQLASIDNVLRLLLELNSRELINFFNYIEFDAQDFYRNYKDKFFIPDELDEFVEDLTDSDMVRNMSIYGVDEYTDEMIEVLSRKMKANPCLIGKAGVGKTTVVYRLAQRIMNKEVPDNLKDTKICYINSSLLTAGTKYRGQFEERMKELIEWASYYGVILFLDEVHTFLNLGKNGDNSSDTAGNMIKKHLSDGTLRIIGATTLSEYHQYIETDKAFIRRLQTIEIKEPSIENTIKMIRNTVIDFENFHGVRVTDEAISEAVISTSRYIKNQCLPDKAYTVIDQASAKAKLANKKKITTTDVLEIISKNSGIDINKLDKKANKKLVRLEDTVHKNIVGQDKAVEKMCKAIRRAKVDIRDYNKPMASFLFVGPTGVGKTELCKIISKEVMPHKDSFIKIDMSEYSEKESISKLIGTAPGYVGYEEGGQLTEKVKHNPHSLILFDELEKAHPEVFNSLLQLLDEGIMTDGHGEKVDFTNCIVVMTSNAGYGADYFVKKSMGFNRGNNSDLSSLEIEDMVRKELQNTFRPEFINRIDNIVIFDKISKEQSLDIAKLLLHNLKKRISNKGININFDNSLIKHIVEIGYSDKYGARNLKRVIQDTVEDTLADYILTDKIKEGNQITMKYNESEITVTVK